MPRNGQYLPLSTGIMPTTQRVSHYPHPVRRVAAAGLLLAIILLGCPARKPSNPDRGTQKQPIAVEVAKVQPATFQETVRGIGSVRARMFVEVRPEIPGVIRGIHFEEGQEVAKGDLLFTLDDSKLVRELAERKAALEAGEAKVENARAVFKRVEELFRRRVAARADLDQAVADLRMAEAETSRLQASLHLTEERLADTRIVAPMNGIASRCPVDIGDYVKEGEDLVNLLQVDPASVSVHIPGRFAGQVREGQQAEVRVDAFPDRSFDGTVTFISPEIAERTRTFLVKITLPNPQRLLKPGAFATAVLITKIIEHRPAVPEEALVATSEGYFVFVVNGHKARLRRVEVGQRRAGIAEIREGIALGELVVQSGHMQLSDGAPIRISDQDDTARRSETEREETRR